MFKTYPLDSLFLNLDIKITCGPNVAQKDCSFLAESGQHEACEFPHKPTPSGRVGDGISIAR